MNKYEIAIYFYAAGAKDNYGDKSISTLYLIPVYCILGN